MFAVCYKLPFHIGKSFHCYSDGKKGWHAILSTDLELKASEILSYYARRWAIEVFFKDAKQMLYMGKEQSNTFDATVACCSFVMIRYLLLVYIFNKRRASGPIGSLLRELSDENQLLSKTQKLWANIKKLIIRSSQVISYKIEPDIVLYLLDLIEDNIIAPTKLLPEFCTKSF